MAVPVTTVGQLQTLMLSWLDDPQAGYFTSTNTITWINFAAREVQKQLVMAGQNYYVIPVETRSVSGQADYVLPSDFLKEHRLELVISGTGPTEVTAPIKEITLNQQDLSTVALGQPENYYIKKDRVTMLPTPMISNQIIRIHYSPRIVDVALTTDVCDIPEEYQEYVALLAAFNGFIKDDRAPENLTMKISKYEDQLKKMAAERTQDASRKIVMTEDYGNFGGFF